MFDGDWQSVLWFSKSHQYIQILLLMPCRYGTDTADIWERIYEEGKQQQQQTNNLVRYYIACEQALDNSVLPLLTQIYKVDLKFPDKVMCNIKKQQLQTVKKLF